MEIKCNFTALDQGHCTGMNKSLSHCLGTPVILRIVLENLSNAELLQVSVVNKLWNFEARTVLRDRGSLIAILKSSSPCQEIPIFASDLQRMNIFPFSGIHIELEKWDNCEGFDPAGALDLNLGAILDRLPCKHLTFCWPKNWEESNTCRAFLLATKILQERCKDLENFTIGLGLGAQDFMRTHLRDCNFLKLKSLDLKVAFALRSRIGSCTKLAQFLLSRAPQLKTVYAHCPISLKENVLEGSSAVLVAGCPVQPFYDEISEDILSSVRLKDVYLAVRNEDFSYERFDRNVKPLLKNSISTLTSLKMDVMFTFLLISRAIRPVNVKELKIYMDYRWLESRQPRLLYVFRGIDFNWIFPNVRKVKVDVNTEIGHIMLDRNRMNEPAFEGTLETPPPDRAVNVKELDVSARVENHDLPSIFRMFTRIEKLTIYRVNGEDIPYELIWEHYKVLKKLTVQQDSHLHQLRLKNLDSVFCGIFPEEVAELRTKDEKFLKSVNIVPVMPSVTCLRGLRTFDLACRDADYEPRPPYYHYQGEVINFNSTFVFSKVTALLAFWRMPNLSIKLHTNFPDFEKALRHMRPYAHVYIEDHNGNPVISGRDV